MRTIFLINSQEVPALQIVFTVFFWFLFFFLFFIYSLLCALLFQRYQTMGQEPQTHIQTQMKKWTQKASDTLCTFLFPVATHKTFEFVQKKKITKNPEKKWNKIVRNKKYEEETKKKKPITTPNAIARIWSENNFQHDR